MTISIDLCYQRFLRGCVALASLVEVLRGVLGPWGSYTDTLILLRPRPPSIQLIR
jgi:hypothetical protein